MPEVLLSIIIPVYNVAEYLQECLESVFKQDLANCEVICVNDGSTDGSVDILKQFKSKYSDLIVISQSNKGLAAARNSGIKHASGKYIYFLDSDDYLLENVIREMLSFALNNNLDLALFNSLNSNNQTYYSLQKKLPEITNGRKFYKFFVEEFNHFTPSVQWLYLYKRKFLYDNDISLFPEDNLQEDEPYTVKAFLHAVRCGMLNKSILYHRLFRDGSITKTAGISHLIDAVKAWKELYYYLRQKQCLDEVFYFKIFDLYQNTIVKAENFNKPKQDIFSSEDMDIMRYCSVNTDLYKYFWYYSKGELLYKWNTSKFPRYKIIKKILNRLLVVYYRLLVKHA